MSKQGPKGGSGCIFLVDANNFLFRAYHGLPPLSAPDGTPVNAVHGYVRMIQAMRKEYAPERIVAIFDAKGSSFRNEIYSDYKANRPPAPEDLVPQIKLVRGATQALGVPWVELENYEADDLIAGYAKASLAAKLRCYVVSADKDLMQLVTPVDENGVGITLWDSMKSRMFDPQAVFDKFGVYPEKLGDLLALAGDSVDNVPGVPGIGPKTAALLLETYGDLDTILEKAPEIKQKKRRENLIEFADQARLSRKLVALDDTVALPEPLEALLDQGIDPEKVKAFFEPLGFRSTITGILSGGSGQQGRRATPAPDEQSIAPMELVDHELSAPELIVKGKEDVLLAFFEAAKGETLGFYMLTEGEDPQRAMPCGFALSRPGKGYPALYVPLIGEGLGVMGRSVVDTDVWHKALQERLDQSPSQVLIAGAKRCSHVLGRVSLDLAPVLGDPEVCSYILDPARGEHGIEALATDLSEVSVKTFESLVGKGKKKVATSSVDWDSATAYAGQCAQLTLALGQHLHAQLDTKEEKVQRLYKEVELPLCAVLARMESKGIALDLEETKRQAKELGDQVAKIRDRIEKEAGYALNPDSPAQLQKLLFEERGLEPTKKTKTGYSTDAKVLEELSLLDPIVRDILDYRSLSKLKGTYLDALPKLVWDDGRIHTHFKQVVAQTGRLSSADPNLQNIPIRTELGRRIRNAFVAPKGQVLVALDYSQIELRVLAHLSGDKSLCGAFRDGADVHRRTASEIFEVPENEVSDEQRRVAKAVNFGVIYGQSAFGLSRQLGIRQGQASRYIKSYFQKIPGVDTYMKGLVETAKRTKVAHTILGRSRRIPELSRRGPAKAYGERIARNTPIQGSAADILKVAMVKVDAAMQEIDWARMLLTVHDELIFECAQEKAQSLVDLVRPLMQDAVTLEVPLVVDYGIGPNWGQAKG